MNNRERTMALLNYKPYDRMPVVHFGYWHETLQKWVQEGHLKEEEIQKYWDGSPADVALAAKVGFDFGWGPFVHASCGLNPPFKTEVLETQPDGTQLVRNWAGAIQIHKPGAGSIHAEVGYTLKDRASWEKEFKHRMQAANRTMTVADPQEVAKRETPTGFQCGSLFGHIRDILGVENTAYLYVDDEPLFREIIDTVGETCYRATEAMLSKGAKFDFGHFWEDICFKNGPLISPSVFAEYVGPHYKRITDLLHKHGIGIVSLDCDGCIDSLIPIWFANGVNTMFPIEVGTWEASIAPWRKKYGKELRGIGGMNKSVFARDYAAVDAEVERLKPLVALGGYIPCPDHRIAPDAKWDNVKYYCEKMRKAFG